MLNTIAAKQVRHDTDFEFWMLVVSIIIQIGWTTGGSSLGNKRSVLPTPKMLTPTFDFDHVLGA